MPFIAMFPPSKALFVGPAGTRASGGFEGGEMISHTLLVSPLHFLHIKQRSLHGRVAAQVGEFG